MGLAQAPAPAPAAAAQIDAATAQANQILSDEAFDRTLDLEPPVAAPPQRHASEPFAVAAGVIASDVEGRACGPKASPRPCDVVIDGAPEFVASEMTGGYGRVGVWRGDFRLSISVCRPFRLAVP